MEAVILIIHLVLALAIVGLVLLQRSEGGGLGIGGGGGMGAFASARSTASVLSRTTAICAAGFFTTSLILGILAGTHHKSNSIMDALDEAAPAAVTTTAPTEDAEVPRPPSDQPSAPTSD